MTTPITKERLIKIKEWRELYGAGSNVVLPAEEAEELARIALASLDAEKVILYRERNPYNGMTTGWQELTDDEYEFIKDNAGENAEYRTVYATPPAPVMPGVWEQWIADVVEYLECGLEADGELEAEGSIEAKRLLSRLAAMLQGADGALTNEDTKQAKPVTTTYKLPPNSFTDDELEMMSHGDNPQANAYRELLAFRRKLPELIEGMDVSIDVSTCDADTGNRYFGTVTELSELDGAKNGYILLVQDAKPNFDVNGNSPVIPDDWVACSERMPDRDYVLAADFSGKQYPANMPNIQIGIYADWFDDGCPCWDDGDGNDLHLKQVTHWTQIPAAPQQEAE